jgi:ferredoxin
VTFVITRLCRDCVDGACVDVCPVDCIVRHEPATGTSDLPNQLFIDPDSCIGCALCEPECPWEAIFDEDAVPAELSDDIALNAVVAERRSEFDVPRDQLARRRPSVAEVEENRRRWQAPEALSKEGPSARRV